MIPRLFHIAALLVRVIEDLVTIAAVVWLLLSSLVWLVVLIQNHLGMRAQVSPGFVLMGFTALLWIGFWWADRRKGLRR